MSYGACVLVLLPLLMLTIVGADTVLGARAKYLNATAILEGWWRLGQEGMVDSRLPMFAGAERMGGPVRLAVGTGLWALEALFLSALVALPIWVARS